MEVDKALPSLTEAQVESELAAVIGANIRRPKKSKESADSSAYQFLYKQKRTFSQRWREANEIRVLHPDKIPVIIERYADEKYVPLLDKSKFLVHSQREFVEFHAIIRRRLQLNKSQSLFLLVSGNEHKSKWTVPSNSITFLELYEKEAHDDGFLYIVFASHEAFGSDMK